MIFRSFLHSWFLGWTAPRIWICTFLLAKAVRPVSSEQRVMQGARCTACGHAQCTAVTLSVTQTVTLRHATPRHATRFSRVKATVRQHALATRWRLMGRGGAERCGALRGGARRGGAGWAPVQTFAVRRAASSRLQSSRTCRARGPGALSVTCLRLRDTLW